MFQNTNISVTFLDNLDLFWNESLITLVAGLNLGDRVGYLYYRIRLTSLCKIFSFLSF